MTTQVACRRRVLLSVLIGSLLVSMGVFAAGKSKNSPGPGKDKHLIDNDLVLENLTDQPDPLSTEVAGSSTITSQYSAKEHPEAP
ncbi:MAG: hypothetical protein KGZ25_01785, partial [Planctomycetes bacterium]|nr:hypothetical protein [Planctomycetota bacterium]